MNLHGLGITGGNGNTGGRGGISGLVGTTGGVVGSVVGGGGEWLHLEMVYDMHCWYNHVPICMHGAVVCVDMLQIVAAYVGLR